MKKFQAFFYALMLFAITSTALGKDLKPGRVYIGQQVSEVYTCVPPANGAKAEPDLISFSTRLGRFILNAATSLEPAPVFVDGHETTVVTNGLTASAIVSSFGQYYIDSGQGQDRLLSLIYQKSFTQDIGIRKTTKDTLYRLGNVEISEVVQGFQKGFTTKGDVTFTPQEIQLRGIKIDQTFTPDDIEESWLGFLAGLDTAARKEWPVSRYVVEKLMQRKEHDMERKVYYQGSYVAPTTNVAGLAINSMDGIRKKITDGIGNGVVDLSSHLSTFTTSNIFEQVELFVTKVLDGREEIAGENFIVCVSPKWKRAYLTDKRNTHGTDVNYQANKVTIDFMENFTLVGLPSMQGYDEIWATPKNNLLHIINRERINPPMMENVDRQVKVYGDWWEAIGFGINEYVFAGLIDASDNSGS